VATTQRFQRVTDLHGIILMLERPCARPKVDTESNKWD
jgi:hypothetical protein